MSFVTDTPAIEWEDAVQDVADTLGLDIDALGLAPMPRADYITLPVPSASASKVDFVPATSGDIPPPPPPLEEAAPEEQQEEVEPEPATTGNKRRTRASAAGGTAKGKGKKGKAAATATTEDEPASKAARTNEGNQSAGGVGKIHTVLREEHYKMPDLPSASDLEAFLVAKQKEELLKEYI